MSTFERQSPQYRRLEIVLLCRIDCDEDAWRIGQCWQKEPEITEIFDRLLRQTFRPRLDLQDAVGQLFSLVLETLEQQPAFYGLIIERQPASDLLFSGNEEDHQNIPGIYKYGLYAPRP